MLAQLELLGRLDRQAQQAPPAPHPQLQVQPDPPERLALLGLPGRKDLQARKVPQVARVIQGHRGPLVFKDQPEHKDSPAHKVVLGRRASRVIKAIQDLLERPVVKGRRGRKARQVL